MPDVTAFNPAAVQGLGANPQHRTGPLSPEKGQAGRTEGDKAHQALKNACSEFEALFMDYMLKEMRATVPESGFISGGKAEALYTSMLDSQMAREIALKRSIGLSSFFLGQLEDENEAGAERIESGDQR